MFLGSSGNSTITPRAWLWTAEPVKDTSLAYILSPVSNKPVFTCAIIQTHVKTPKIRPQMITFCFLIKKKKNNNNKKACQLSGNRGCKVAVVLLCPISGSSSEVKQAHSMAPAQPWTHSAIFPSSRPAAAHLGGETGGKEGQAVDRQSTLTHKHLEY